MHTYNFSPLVSIVIPVYNGCNYMRSAIDSALLQTYPNIEVLVINDGSSDDGKTEAIPLSYGNRFRYFHKENGGCASALNVGLANMRGEYFSWLSHDDLYSPDKIQHQITILKNLTNQNTIVYGGYEVINPQSETVAIVQPEKLAPIEKLSISLYPLMHTLINGCTLLIPNKYFKELGIFDEKLISTHDYALWFKFLRIAPIYFDPMILVKYRVHPQQSTHTIKTHSKECEDFWIEVLQQLTPIEMCQMEGSVAAFLEKKLASFKTNAYDQAYSLAKTMLGNVKTPPKKFSKIATIYKNGVITILTVIQSFRRVGFFYTWQRIYNRIWKN